MSGHLRGRSATVVCFKSPDITDWWILARMKRNGLETVNLMGFIEEEKNE
jgi:hypothetical protein